MQKKSLSRGRRCPLGPERAWKRLLKASAIVLELVLEIIGVGIRAQRAAAGPVYAWRAAAGVKEHAGSAAGCGRSGRLAMRFCINKVRWAYEMPTVL